MALVFSIIAGLLGITVVAWYGMGELGAIAKSRDQEKIKDLSASTGTSGEGHAGGVLKTMMAK